MPQLLQAPYSFVQSQVQFLQWLLWKWWMMRIPFSNKGRKRNPIKPVWFSVLLRKKSRVKGSLLYAQMFILQLCGTLFLLRCSWLILISLWYLLKTTMTNPSYVLRIFFRNFRKLVMSLCPVHKYLNFWCHP